MAREFGIKFHEGVSIQEEASLAIFSCAIRVKITRTVVFRELLVLRVVVFRSIVSDSESV